MKARTTLTEYSVAQQKVGTALPMHSAVPQKPEQCRPAKGGDGAVVPNTVPKYWDSNEPSIAPMLIK